MNKIVVFFEKHTTRYFLVSEEDMAKPFLKIFKERDSEDCYELRDPDAEKYYQLAKDDGHPLQAKAARQFIISRCDYEYEGYDSITPEEI